MLKARDKSGKNLVLKSETLNLFQNNRVNSFSYFFVTLVQVQCPFLYTLLLDCLSFHPFAYFITYGYLLQTPNNSNSRKLELFSTSLEGLGYQELTVAHCFL